MKSVFNQKLWTEAGPIGRLGPRAARRVDTEEVRPGRESATNLRRPTVENHAVDQLPKSSSVLRQIAVSLISVFIFSTVEKIEKVRFYERLNDNSIFYFIISN